MFPPYQMTAMVDTRSELLIKKRYKPTTKGEIVKWMGIIIVMKKTRYRGCMRKLWDNVSEYTLLTAQDFKKQAWVTIDWKKCGILSGRVINMFTIMRECHMPSITVSLSETFLIVLMITGLQTLFLQIFYVQTSPCKSGMNWESYGLYWPQTICGHGSKACQWM